MRYALGVLRFGSVLLLCSAFAFGYAPLQCGEADPAKALEETPGEALYKLGEQFRERGEQTAWEGTLRYLIETYPSSRFAVRAAHDLREAGLDAGVPPVGESAE